jgi:hypothetical protein
VERRGMRNPDTAAGAGRSSPARNSGSGFHQVGSPTDEVGCSFQSVGQQQAAQNSAAVGWVPAGLATAAMAA